MLTWEGQLPVLQPHCLAYAADRRVLGWCTLIAQGLYCRITPGASPPLSHILSSRVKAFGYLNWGRTSTWCKGASHVKNKEGGVKGALWVHLFCIWDLDEIAIDDIVFLNTFRLSALKHLDSHSALGKSHVQRRHGPVCIIWPVIHALLYEVGTFSSVDAAFGTSVMLEFKHLESMMAKVLVSAMDSYTSLGKN